MNMLPDHDYPQAPLDVVMPATVQSVLLSVSMVTLIIFFIVALIQCRRHKTFLPVLFLIGGFFTIPMEPLVDLLGHAVHPEIGQISLFKVGNRAIPWHGAVMYAFYFGGVYMFMLPRIMANHFTVAYVWKAYLTTTVLAYLFEIVPVQWGLWVYYDQQALWFWKGGMPLFWPFVNSIAIFVPLTLIKLCYPILKGWRQGLVVLLSPVGALAGHFGAGFPFYNAANSAASRLVIELSGVLSIGLCFLIIYICARLLAADTRRLFEDGATQD